MVKMTKLMATGALLMLSVFSTVVAAATIQVHADRNPVGLNESFHLVYQSDGSVDDDPDFSPLEKYLDILNRSQSSNMSIINGKYSSSKTWTLTAMAKQKGSFTLPPISFGSDKSASYQLKVKAASKTAASDADFYSRLEASQQQVYAQQQLVITQQLFSVKNLSAYGMGDLDFNGSDVVLRKLGEEKQYQTQIGGRQYLVIERRYAVFPQSDGLLSISPVLAEARVDSGRNSFFGNLGGGQVIRARSNALSITVLPVPKNVGVAPWLPAANLTLQEQWPQNPPHFVEGEPLTRTVSIKAEGLTAAQLPDLPSINVDGWKQYPDQPLLNDIANDDGITGYRVEKVALIPMHAGRLVLPAIEIKWWNTRTQTLQTAKIPQRVVQVAAAPAASRQPAAPPASQPAASAAPAKIVPEPVSPPLQPDAANSSSRSFAAWPWQWISALLAGGWLLTLLLWWMRARQASSKQAAAPVHDAANQHSRKHHIKAHLKVLKAACQAEDLTALRQALLAWGEDHFASVLTLAQISDRLPAALATEIRKLDAVLYGAQAQAPDCRLIVDGIEQLERQHQQHDKASRGAPLEPLYR